MQGFQMSSGPDHSRRVVPGRGATGLQSHDGETGEESPRALGGPRPMDDGGNAGTDVSPRPGALAVLVREPWVQLELLHDADLTSPMDLWRSPLTML